MNFGEAFIAMQAGHKVRRPSWDKDKQWYFCAKRNKILSTIIGKTSVSAIGGCSLYAKDWEIVQELHDWKWAWKKLQKGHDVTRVSWKHQGFVRMDGAGYANIHPINSCDNERTRPMVVCFIDMEAEDWIHAESVS